MVCATLITCTIYYVTYTLLIAMQLYLLGLTAALSTGVATKSSLAQL